MSTKPYLPYRLIYYEELPDRKSAILREKELKLSGRKFLRSFI